jgi:preprotein translocase subunit SecF
VFIAPALLAVFKEREPGMQALRRRVMAKRAAAATAASAPAGGAPVAVGAGAVKAEPRKQDRPSGTTPTPAARPMKATGAGRPQPSRKPRSKRGK